MKIEKVNENQIRCTLTREDLASRELKISELAYGTEKAKNLFRDMMQQANFEFGFEAEDIPLMIEAIPLNAECIVLIITKVEDPEELDTRFSRFAPSSVDEEGEDFDDSEDELTDNSEEVMDLFRRLHENRRQSSDTGNAREDGKEEAATPILTRIFRFNSLQPVLAVSRLVGGYYRGGSTLYKEEREGIYLLVLTQGELTPEEFNKASNIISEYGSFQKVQPATHSYLDEHFSPIVKDTALQSLASL